MKLRILVLAFFVFSALEVIAQKPAQEKVRGTDKWLQSSLLRINPFNAGWSLSGFGGNSSINGASYSFSITVDGLSLDEAKSNFYERLKNQLKNDGYLINGQGRGKTKKFSSVTINAKSAYFQGTILLFYLKGDDQKRVEGFAVVAQVEL